MVMKSKIQLTKKLKSSSPKWMKDWVLYREQIICQNCNKIDKRDNTNQDDYCLDCYKALYPTGWFGCWEGD